MLHTLRISSRRVLPRPAVQRAATTPILPQRTFHQASRAMFPRKDAQDRESIDTESTEYSKSGSDDAAARNEEAAFDPSKTSPESQKQKAGEGHEGNPLDVSPANPEVSKPRGETEGGAQKGAGKGQSGGGSPAKNGKP